MSKNNFINKLKNTELSRKEMAEILAVSEATISLLLSGNQEPTKQHKRILELYLGERKPFSNPKIEAVAQIMESLDPAAQEDILRIAEKEKRLAEIKEEPERKAA